MDKTGGPAFGQFVHAGHDHYREYAGMTLRDYMAGQALGGLITKQTEPRSWLQTAAEAYLIADAMIKARGE